MPKTYRKKVASRRLKVDRLRGEGLTYVQIAKQLNVSTKTVKRDCIALDEEMTIEPAYTEGRLRIREELGRRFEELYERILKDLDEAHKASVRVQLEVILDHNKDIGKIQGGEELLSAALGSLKIVKVKKRVSTPDWGKVAALHREATRLLELWAKVLGLLTPERWIESDTQEAQRSGVIVVPMEAKISED